MVMDIMPFFSDLVKIFKTYMHLRFERHQLFMDQEVNDCYITVLLNIILLTLPDIDFPVK